jgi:hypothetical protein
MARSPFPFSSFSSSIGSRFERITVELLAAQDHVADIAGIINVLIRLALDNLRGRFLSRKEGSKS